MLRGTPLAAALARIDGLPRTVLAARAVPLVKFTEYVQSKGRPNLRFMSGSPNRYNLQGTLCLYVAEERETARTELRHGMGGIELDEAIFSVDCRLESVLDLTDDAVHAALKLSEKELFAAWEMARRPTATQRLGELVLNGERFDAIRFPSNAMRAEGKAGVNLVIAADAALDPHKVTVGKYGDVSP